MTKKIIILIVWYMLSIHSINAQNIASSPVFNGQELAQTHSPSKPKHNFEFPLKEIYRTGTHYLAFSATVSEPEDFSIKFGDTNLGKGSFLYIEHLENGEFQYFDAKSLNDYNNTTYEIASGNVKVELYVLSTDQEINFSVNSKIVRPTINEKTESICNGTDGRSPTIDRAIGRSVGPTCSLWITSNGSLLAAGHCFQDNNGVRTGLTQVDFNRFDQNGSPLPLLAINRYRVNPASLAVENQKRRGDDWAVFTCLPNSTTGLTPIQAQGEFYRMSRDHRPSKFRITGYGIDDAPFDRVLQTASGNIGREVRRGENRVFWTHTVDTEPGNSGSPLIMLNTRTAVGIHTNGGCDRNFVKNAGTSFESDDLERAIHEVHGLRQNVIYVDNGDIVTLEDGSVFRPFSNFTRAIQVVPAGGLIASVEGNYRESINIQKTLRIIAPPVGSTRIGPNVPLNTGRSIDNIAGVVEDSNNDFLFTNAEDEEPFALISESLDEVLENVIIYPNPVYDEIKFQNLNGDLKSMKIIDITGKVIFNATEKFIRNNPNPSAISIGNILQNATYILEVKTSEMIIRKKIRGS